MAAGAPASRKNKGRKERPRVYGSYLLGSFLEGDTDYFLSHLEFIYTSIPNYREVWVV